MKFKLLNSGHIFGSRAPWPAPGKWPEVQPCGEKAKCRDCKNIWSLKMFNNHGNPRKDGTYKKFPHCIYCQSSKNAKKRLVKAHREREQAREV